MPYDLVKETGTWTTSKSSDNWSECLVKLGVPSDMVEKVKQEKYDVVVTVSGDTCTYKMTEFGETSVNTFTFGVEAEEKDSMGSRKVIHTLEGDALVSNYPNYDGKGMPLRTSRRWLNDNTILAACQATVLKKMRVTEFPLDISLSGNVMTSKLVHMGKAIENSLTMGDEGEENDLSDKKRRTALVVFTRPKETGTWKASGNSDNYGEILQKLGVPPDMLPKVLEIEYSVEMSVSGDTFTYKITEFGQTSVNTFTLGVESEEKDAWGTTRMVTYSMEGDSLVNTYPSVDGKGLKFSSARRFMDDNTIRTELKVGDLVGWSEAKRVV
uniref:Lipocalin/cytosolic fatty-acid binding domain-containing protein n=1 Tax=Branchiostoma floridae TaxID=7739 RepID=C3YII2_BRAFL|eukprot:XP_002603904.1 hypothetical protein BRAFLDRAFT_130001 [Branchiostoma floridae]